MGGNPEPVAPVDMLSMPKKDFRANLLVTRSLERFVIKAYERSNKLSVEDENSYDWDLLDSRIREVDEAVMKAVEENKVGDVIVHLGYSNLKQDQEMFGLLSLYSGQFLADGPKEEDGYRVFKKSTIHGLYLESFSPVEGSPRIRLLGANKLPPKVKAEFGIK